MGAALGMGGPPRAASLTLPGMPIGRPFNALVSWIACTALLMSLWAPALAQAFRTPVPAGWADICSASGMQRVMGDGGSATQADQSADSGHPTEEGAGAHGLKHCPYCATHATVLGLPPAPRTVLPQEALASHVPALFLTAPRPLFAWVSAQPRAPPLRA